MTAICKPLPGRICTYAVVIPYVDIVVGWVRLDVGPPGRWIARTTGCPQGKTAAQMRHFENRAEAVAFLVEREPIVKPGTAA
jgi:hypothetical protein